MRIAKMAILWGSNHSDEIKALKWWGERRGSNPRQPESQSGTLPTELRPPLKISDYSF